jgi:GTP:adenosylcobinamide-phosphate guanylyltransferase
MKAIVFATDYLSGSRIDGLSSPFFSLQNKPILLYVLVALDQLSDINEIVIVGPVSQIMRVLEAALFEVPFSKKMTVLAQKNGLLDDLKSAVTAVSQQESDVLQVLPPDEPVLCLPGNIPLLTTAEIEAFIASSDMGSYDYCIGITEESALRAFYPEAEKSGIKMPCIQLQDKQFRLNNLHLIYPQKVFGIAEQHPKNVTEIRSSMSISDVLPNYIAEIFKALLDRDGREAAFWPLYQNRSIASLEVTLSELSHLNLKFAGRWKGGAALNIDDAESHRIVSERIKDWRILTDDLNQTAEGKKQCPSSGLACEGSDA